MEQQRIANPRPKVEQGWGELSPSVSSGGSQAQDIETVVPGNEMCPRFTTIIESHHGISDLRGNSPFMENLKPVFVRPANNGQQITNAECTRLLRPIVVLRLPNPLAPILVPGNHIADNSQRPKDRNACIRMHV
jgi:hypothetical protein